SGKVRLDLELHLWEDGATFAGSARYSTDLFDRQTIEQLLVHYQRLLAGAVANPDTPLSRLALLGEEERRRILVEWNDTHRTWIKTKTAGLVHERFAAEAARRPEGLALSNGVRRLTYGELDRRSNQLARYVQRLGVRPEVRVGLCVERG